MTWHESDTDLQAEWALSVARKLKLDNQSKEERTYQERIGQLKMVETSEMTSVTDKDGKTYDVQVTVFKMPKNFAGEDMASEYRDSQKSTLIENNTERLEE